MTHLNRPSRRDALHLMAAAASLAATAEAGAQPMTTQPMSIKPTETDVLIVVDVQNDFLPGGSLAVPKGDEVIAPINTLAKDFAHVVLTQDWHAPHHISFASSHPGKTPFEMITLADGRAQVLWPNHCVQGSHGAAIADAIEIPTAELVIRKGFHPNVDSYSAFKEADRKTTTGLAGYLKERGFKRVFVAGLATDFCVGWTAIDARGAGFETFMIEDASRGIDTNGSMAKAMADMAAAGVHWSRRRPSPREPVGSARLGPTHAAAVKCSGGVDSPAAA